MFENKICLSPSLFEYCNLLIGGKMFNNSKWNTKILIYARLIAFYFFAVTKIHIFSSLQCRAFTETKKLIPKQNFLPDTNKIPRKESLHICYILCIFYN